MGPVVLGKYSNMRNRSKALKIYTIVMIIATVVVMIYSFFFYLDYAVTYKYTIDNGFQIQISYIQKLKEKPRLITFFFYQKEL